MVDSGHGVTSVMPMVDGFALPPSVSRMDVGGREVTAYLAQLLNRGGEYRFSTASELQWVRQVKEKVCAVREERVDAVANPSFDSTGMMGTHKAQGFAPITSKLQMGSAFMAMGKRMGAGRERQEEEPLLFTLPDHNQIEIGTK